MNRIRTWITGFEIYRDDYDALHTDWFWRNQPTELVAYIERPDGIGHMVRMDDSTPGSFCRDCLLIAELFGEQAQPFLMVLVHYPTEMMYPEIGKLSLRGMRILWSMKHPEKPVRDSMTSKPYNLRTIY